MKTAPTRQPSGDMPVAIDRSPRYEKQRARVVEAAILLVNERGVGGMTLQEVAQALDLTTTSVTYYYRYKEQLAAAVFEDTMRRLAAMVDRARQEPTPRMRVARYTQLYFAQFARALRGEERPLAILSELRTLEEARRRPLLEMYQDIFRGVRALFGENATPERRRLNSARAQILNEALFWSALWLRRYPAEDLGNVRRRMFDILEHGIASGCGTAGLPALDPDADQPDDAGREFLHVAARLINDSGYKGASVERIVKELRLTKGSFYHHHDTKNDLILECYHNDYDRIVRLVAAIGRREASAGARLACGVASALNLQFDGLRPLLRTTALQAMPHAVREVAIGRFDSGALWLSGFLVDGMVEGAFRVADPMIGAHIIISTINSAYDMRSWARGHPRAEAIETYADILLHGLFEGE